MLYIFVISVSGILDIIKKPLYNKITLLLLHTLFIKKVWATTIELSHFQAVRLLLNERVFTMLGSKVGAFSAIQKQNLTCNGKNFLDFERYRLCWPARKWNEPQSTPFPRQWTQYYYIYDLTVTDFL